MITTREGNEEMRGARAEQSRIENKGEQRRKEEKRIKEEEGPRERVREAKEEKKDLMRSTGCYSGGCHNKIHSGYTGQRVGSQHPVSVCVEV